jgi:Bacterial capsule synthesis protein PGA_cap
MTSITLVGDWSPGRLKVNCDFKLHNTFVNLEGPIDQENMLGAIDKIQKVGPHIKSQTPPSNLDCIFASLANNHIMDYGIRGAQLTMEYLSQKQISFAGIASDSCAYSKTDLAVEDKKICVIALAEEQFGSARAQAIGYATDFSAIYKEILSEKELGKIVVVSNHGGLENSYVPSPEQVSLYRSFVDVGADIVYGHHSHKPQSYEIYRDRPIFYGLGNFASDPNTISHKGLGRFSLVVKINLDELSNPEIYIAEQKIQSSLEFLPTKIVIHVIPLASSALMPYVSKINFLISQPEMHGVVWTQIAKDSFNKHLKTSMNIENSFFLILKFYLVRTVSRLKSRNFRNSNFERINNLYWYHLFSTRALHEVLRAALDTQRIPIESKSDALTLLEELQHYD